MSKSVVVTKFIFHVYEQKGRDLIHVATMHMGSGKEARDFWTQEYGDNYGKVVIIPQLRGDDHHVMAEVQDGTDVQGTA